MGSGELESLGEPTEAGLARMGVSLGLTDLRVESVERLMGGSQARTHAVRLEPLGWVVLKRWPTSRSDPAGMESARLDVANRTGLVVPRPMAVDPHGRWFGHPALVMTRVEGQRRLHARSGPWIGAAADALATIHETDLPAHDHPVLGAPHFAIHWEPVPAERFPRAGRVGELLEAVAGLQRDFRPAEGMSPAGSASRSTLRPRCALRSCAVASPGSPATWIRGRCC